MPQALEAIVFRVLRLLGVAVWLWSTFSLPKFFSSFLSLWDVEFFKLPHDGLWIGFCFGISAFFGVCFDVGCANFST
jgi:hypothetical protein